ncbi:MAG: aminotransferase class V-fold PLP-dependent enzyme [Proteobacteria bacterium]|nr:aminotransferase class V-fold PLP-dependent enzyme [Pseudomonadota bacterium]
MVAFGHASRALWPLEPGITYLNHGTVGVTPLAVMDAQEALRRRVEAQPARFMRHELKPGLRQAADLAARLFGGRGSDYVFTENATAGVNAVLRSLDLRAGDEVLVTDHAYGAVRNAAAYACRRAGAILKTAAIPFPLRGREAAVDAVAAALSPRTRLAVIDHITLETALILPVTEIAALCRTNDTRLLVDGAHAPGTLPLDIPALGCDWYAANLHKWYFAPRGCGLLWAGEAAQDSLHPASVSWNLDGGFTAEFDWTGTRDFTSFLAFPDAARFMERLGAERVRAHNHALVLRAAVLLAGRFGPDLAPAPEFAGSMALAPLPERFPADAESAGATRDALLFQHGVEVPVIVRNGRLWARLAAQVYCDMTDFERLADALATMAPAPVTSG